VYDQTNGGAPDGATADTRTTPRVETHGGRDVPEPHLP